MTLHFSPASDAYETAVDDVIATCNDVRGALKALIFANELLERDLQAAASPERGEAIVYAN